MRYISAYMRLPFMVCVVLLCGAADSASAQQPFRAQTWNRPSASGGLRLATYHLGVGLGARAGFTFEPGFYVGGLFDYYLGDSHDHVTGEQNHSAWTLMAEGGYDMGLLDGALVIRPSLMLGAVDFASEFCTNSETCTETSKTNFRASIGGQALYFLAPNLSVGGELRLLFIHSTAAIFGINMGGVL